MRRFLLLFLLLTLTLPSPASAQSSAVCHTYSLTDGFEGSSASLWSPWNASQTGGIRLGETSSARRGSSAALLNLSKREPVGGFVLIDKLFNVGQATSAKRLPHYGCEEPAWPPPSGPTKYCQASAWILPAGAGAAGQVQIIDPDTWTYRTSQSFNVVGRPGWTKVSTPASTGFCDRDVVVRVVLSRDSTTSEAAAVDDVTVTWFFGPSGNWPP